MSIRPNPKPQAAHLFEKDQHENWRLKPEYNQPGADNEPVRVACEILGVQPIRESGALAGLMPLTGRDSLGRYYRITTGTVNGDYARAILTWLDHKDRLVIVAKTIAPDVKPKEWRNVEFRKLEHVLMEY